MKKIKTVAVIVAHPDDETLWCGGTILSHPSWSVFIMTLCRASDQNRAPKFFEALEILRAQGKMADLDDAPGQKLLDENLVQETILELLPQKHFDIIMTHNPDGEYTRHIRHEEVSKAVIKLWHAGTLSATELWTFAYEDGDRKYYPKPIESATIFHKLTKRIWLRKQSIITDIYEFETGSFEAETSPKAEAFWKFSNSYDARQWLKNNGT
ncbi:MAG: GlcNAc-PI de-N-acetylase [Bacteroidetes bacterium GWF2_40_14]|nr:MAG: GlcNAc-PI de-N-acetylase [Bacteroidetes bacterium GWF2_40_14]